MKKKQKKKLKKGDITPHMEGAKTIHIDEDCTNRNKLLIF